MKQFKILFSIFPLIFISTNIVAQNIVFGNENDIIDISSRLYRLETDRNILLEDILADDNQQKFKKNSTGSPRKIANDKSIWIKFSVQNKSGREVYVELRDFSIPNFEFYTSKNNPPTYTHKKFGNTLPFINKEVVTNFYLIPLLSSEDTTVRTFYIHIVDNNSFRIPVRISNIKNFVRENHQRDILYGSFLGIMVIMALYNFFIFLTLRDKTYLFYVLHIICTSLTTLTFTGYSFDLFWPNYPQMNHIILAFTIGVPLIFLILFTMSFLKTKKDAPIWHRGLQIFILIFLINTGYSVFDLRGMQFNQLTALVLFIYLFVLANYVYFKGNKVARFYILANGSFMLGVITIILTASGVLPSNIITENSNQIGTVLEVLLFSFALADRIKVLTNENNNALNENIRLIEEQKDFLEKKVKERTFDLEHASQEILTQNEELHQQQEELEAQRDFIGAQIIELKASQKKINSSIQSALTIQQAILPYKEKINTILRNYFIINIPRDIVSGDFYWINQIDGQTVLVVADCTGHGVPGAFMTLIGNTLLDKIIGLSRIIEPDQILTVLHEEIKQILMQKQTGNNAGMDATVLAIEYLNNGQAKIKFAGAKHDIIYYDSEKKEILELKGNRKAIGGFQNEGMTFTKQEVNVSIGSIFYTGSDGYEDQNDLKRKKFGRSRFKNLIESIAVKEMSEQESVLVNTLQQFMHGTEQRDDILLLGIQI